MIIDFEFLKQNQILNSDLDSQQQHVHENLLRKCLAHINARNIVFLVDNARPHIQQESKRKKNWI